MLFKFIGKDGPMGLQNGRVYECSICTLNRCVWIRWTNPNKIRLTRTYTSFKELFQEWEEQV